VAPIDSALQLLLRGDVAAARTAFERLAAGPDADFAVHLGLASACLALGDAAAAGTAADGALALAPRDPRALVVKGDAMHQQGDRGASAFYAVALRVAGGPAAWPPDLAPILRHAQGRVDAAGRAFEAELRACAAEAAQRVGEPSARFLKSLDLLSGKRQRYEQQPTMYYLPGLASVPFFEPGDFPWLPALEAQTAAIREELLAVMRQPQSFSPYVARDSSRPQLNDSSVVDNHDWSAYFLWKDGEPVAAHAAQCPHTMAALQRVPLPRIPGRSPNVLFSLLRPGAHIPAHHGFLNTRLIVHLPLIVPTGCRFRVGDEIREWREGRAWVFDDTIEHEAWNDGPQTRVVLLFEIWRPELSEGERSHVGALFEAIARHRGRGLAWGI
jgi:aspartyl/asparaginyl beta-hydroxylase (cupin superfamily)